MRMGCAVIFFWAAACLAQRGPLLLPAAVGTYCLPCHNPRLAEHSIQLDPVKAREPWADRATFERVLRQLRARAMPPAGNPRPDEKTYTALVEDLASALDATRTVTPVRISDDELAWRLARFLWNAAPDEALLQLARQNRLRDPVVLEAQLQRMLADAKISALVSGFFDPWLELNQLTTLPADATAFPELDADMRGALKRETEMFVESQLHEDRPAIELWTANYTFVNERLARLYGIAGVSGPQFRRVQIDGTRRAGLLGQASILTITSVLTRHAAVDGPSTSPASRARWIRTHFLDIPLRDPLPNPTPMLKGVLLSQQLREIPDPSCDACHSNFLPLGYALENFDPLGRWRDQFAHQPIDASGTLADGTEFEGPDGLRRVLLPRADAFYTTLTEKLLDYAIGGAAAAAQPTPPESIPPFAQSSVEARISATGGRRCWPESPARCSDPGHGARYTAPRCPT